MRNILIHADDGPGMPARLESGLAIGRRHCSYLDLVISSPFQQFIATDPFGGMYLASEQLAKAQAADAALDGRLRADLEREDVPWNVTLADGDVRVTWDSGFLEYSYAAICERIIRVLREARSAAPTPYLES